MRTRRDLYDQIMRSKHGIKRDELLAQPQKFLVLAKANSLYDKSYPAQAEFHRRPGHDLVNVEQVPGTRQHPAALPAVLR